MAQLQKPDSVNLVDAALNSFFEQSIADAAEIDDSYVRLWKTSYDLIRAGGKKLRSKMLILSYEAFGGKDIPAIIPVASAQELLHFSLLVHDDIIDRDYTRYGVANVAGHYKIIYSKYAHTPADRVHFANSAAILAGDLALSGAHRLIAESTLSDQEKTLAQQFLVKGIFHVAGGELLDTELSFMPYRDGDALNVALHKTASYSFTLPLVCGASLAGIDEKRKGALEKYATSLGIAYQLMDDILGVFGDEGVTGKSTVGDIVEGKRTYMVEQALKVFSNEEKTAFMLGYGNPHATAIEIEHVKQLLERSGAKEKTLQKIIEYRNDALSALDAMLLDEKYKDQFASLVTKVTERSY